MKSVQSMALSTAIGIALASTGMYSMGALASPTHAAPESSAKTNARETSEPYIITYTEAGLINYTGGVATLERTAPDASRNERLNRNTPAARNYEAYLEAQREMHRTSIESVLRRTLEVTHSYGITFNGVAADLSEAEAERIRALPGVESVRPAGVYHIDTYRGPEFIGAGEVWNNFGSGDKGEGVKVGIIDSGANSMHPSFANDAACGFSASNPKLIAKDCSSSSGGICNGGNPQAASGNGHGVHTAGTAAGNTIDNTASPSPGLPGSQTMSGVAPCAQVYSYLVCATNTCAGAWIAAGIQNAIADGVDVINFSISGGTSPWGDNDRTFLDAVGNGTFVAASAGNTSDSVPNPVGQVNHRGPWVMTVAASTHDKQAAPRLTLTGPGTPPATTQNVALNPGSTTFVNSTPNWSGKPIKTYPGNLIACSANGVIPPNTFSNSIAVVRRGDCPFTEKITNAYNAGAEMVVIANNAAGGINMDTTGAPNVPAYSIGMTEGDAIISFVGTNPSNSVADVTALLIEPRQGDVLADFSFRGPTPGNLADLTKPDITAPGVDIYAATDPGSGQYEFMSGTSMSGPHVAGAGALMKGVHGDWSPVEIRSALMMTAKLAGFRENGTTPWNIDDTGSGRVQVDLAALAGLTMNETKANFLAANPSGGSINIKELNVPSMRNMNCNYGCSWTRTVRNRMGMAGNWTVSSDTPSNFSVAASPSTFSLAPDAEQTITFTATPNTNITAIAFGNVFLTEDAGLSPEQHITVAIKGQGGTSYTVGGTASGTSGAGLALKLNGGANLAVAGDGAFTFPDTLPDGTAYTVTVATAPAQQVCEVANGSGTISGANVTNVQVTCQTVPHYTIGGTVSGTSGAGLALKLNGGAPYSIAGDGPFAFPETLPSGANYTVTISTPPTGQTCSVVNGSGTVAAANVDNVSVICTDNPPQPYPVGGRIRGLAGTVVLQLNDGLTISRGANGIYNFIPGLSEGDDYEVTVLTQPAGQLCVVSNATGTMPAAPVTNADVDCAAATPEIFEDGFED